MLPVMLVRLQPYQLGAAMNSATWSMIRHSTKITVLTKGRPQYVHTQTWGLSVFM